MCSLAHLIAFDYTYVHDPDTSTISLHNKTPVSINAIFFASVIVVSRLHDNTAVVGLILLSWSIFGLFPELRKVIRASSIHIYSLLPILTSSVVTVLLFLMFPAIIGLAYLMILVIITILGPILFIYFY